MISASLLSMIFHSLGPENLAQRISAGKMPQDFKSPRDAITELSYMKDAMTITDWPRIPIVGRTKAKISFDHWFQGSVTVDPLPEGETFFWGRVPVDRLIAFASEFRGWDDPKQLYVDAGTPIRAAGSGTSYDQTCNRLLAKTAASPASAKVGVAIVDLSSGSANAPDTYGGRLRHVVTSHEMDDHAEKVLSVLLEELDTKNMLPDVTVSCALVVPPNPGMIKTGMQWFEQTNVVEMLDALKQLYPQLNVDNLPTVINMSLGTHVGPHNGDSPLEDYIAKTLVVPNKQFVVAAAGNDGGKGLAAKCSVDANQREYLTLRTGSRCRELLVEFWWDETASTTVQIEAQIYMPLPTGGRSGLGTVYMVPGGAGRYLMVAPAGLPGTMMGQSLFHSRAHNNLSCIAFALSTNQQALPMLEIKFAMDSITDVMVNGWIALQEVAPQTAFIEGGSDGTIRVPATNPAILSVAGLESPGKLWGDSARGPGAEYQPGVVNDSGPLMAHDARLGGAGEVGTSFASPRASADAAVVLNNSAKLSYCNDATDLVCQMYGLARTAIAGTWNRKFGYHKAI